jgi:response regulator RpfG family c-di-GMP phosphodiesterase
LQSLKLHEQAVPVRFMMIAIKADIEEQLHQMSDTVEEFIPKPFLVKELSQCAKNNLDRIQLEKVQEHSSQEGVIRGRLSETNLIDLFQSLEMGQKTCSLTGTKNEETCRTFFEAGTSCIMQDVAQCWVMKRSMSWSDASFEINLNAIRIERRPRKSHKNC